MVHSVRSLVHDWRRMEEAAKTGGLFASSVLVLLPCPFSGLLLIGVVIRGTNTCFVALSDEMRDGVEHKFSDLPRDEVRLDVYWKLFSSFF